MKVLKTLKPNSFTEWEQNHLYESSSFNLYLCIQNQKGTMSLVDLRDGQEIEIPDLKTGWTGWNDVTNQYAVVHNHMIVDEWRNR